MDSDATRKLWRERIEQGLSSGMPIKQWCELNRVGYSTFHNWATRFRDEDSSLPQGNANWIEIARTSKMKTNALAVSVPPAPLMQAPAAAPVPAMCTPSQKKPIQPCAIHVLINGAEISIAPGTRKHDIENVLSCVAAL